MNVANKWLQMHVNSFCVLIFCNHMALSNYSLFLSLSLSLYFYIYVSISVSLSLYVSLSYVVSLMDTPIPSLTFIHTPFSLLLSFHLPLPLPLSLSLSLSLSRYLLPLNFSLFSFVIQNNFFYIHFLKQDL